MWLAIIGGVVLGWLLTNVAQGAIQGRYYYRFDEGLYKDLTESTNPCPHALDGRQRINGITLAPCQHCPALFAKVDDLQAVHYE